MTKPRILGMVFLTFWVFGCSTGPGPEMYMVSPADLKILDETKAFFSDESKWTRGEDTTCDVDAQALTLFCALQKASFDVIKDFQLRRPALEEVRYAIDTMSTTALDRRILDFNNLETTNLDDIRTVLDIARTRIQARLEAQGESGN